MKCPKCGQEMSEDRTVFKWKRDGLPYTYKGNYFRCSRCFHAPYTFVKIGRRIYGFSDSRWKIFGKQPEQPEKVMFT